MSGENKEKEASNGEMGDDAPQLRGNVSFVSLNPARGGSRWEIVL